MQRTLRKKTRIRILKIIKPAGKLSQPWKTSLVLWILQTLDFWRRPAILDCMRNRRGMLLIAVLVGILWLMRPSDEPIYQGERLSTWLARTEVPARDVQGGLAALSNAHNAWKGAGTNAIPTVLKRVRARDAGLKLNLGGLAQKQ